MFKEKIKNFVGSARGKMAVVGATVGVSALSVVPCFAEEGSTFVVTEAMIAPIGTTITTSMTNMLPVGLAVMGVGLCIGLIPRFIYKFLG